MYNFRKVGRITINLLTHINKFLFQKKKKNIVFPKEIV